MVTSIPGPRSQELIARKAAAVAAGVGHTVPIQAVAAGGGVVVDADGNSLIDLGAGIAVTTLGNAHPKVVAAVQEQVAQFTHTCFMISPYESYVAVAEALNRITPGAHAKKTALFNSGAEAVENAVKIARKFTKKQAVVAFDHGYHGRTNLTMALTAKSMPYKSGFGPFASEVYRAPMSYPFRDGLSGSDAAKKAISIIEKQVGADNLAAIIIEPIQGEGGFIVPADGFLPALVDWCRANDVVFIADEIQTGFARSGAMFASEHFGIVPDLITTAKGIAGGLPLAAVTGRSEIMDASHAGGLGGTYGGNPDRLRRRAGRDRRLRERGAHRARERAGRDPDRAPRRDPGIRPAPGGRPRTRCDGGGRVRAPHDGRAGCRAHRRGCEGVHRAGCHRAHVRHLRQRHPLPSSSLHLRRPAPRGPRCRRRGAERRVMRPRWTGRGDAGPARNPFAPSDRAKEPTWPS